MIETVLSKLRKVRNRGGGRYIACCPVHDDRNPSMSIREIDGKILLTCFGCGAGAHEIVEALGLSLNDLFSGDIDYHQSKPSRINPADAIECLKTESLIVYFAALRMAKGEQVDVERLKRSAQIIQVIYEENET